MSKTIKINGKKHQVDAADDTPLLWVIRDHLKMTGTKFGCGLSLCGACTVHLDGKAMRSCQTPLSAALDAEITTIEGLQSKEAVAVKKAWEDIAVVQCGYCQSGQIMSAVAMLSENPAPNDEEIDAGMAGNICRCGTYVRIRAAIKQAAKSLT